MFLYGYRSLITLFIMILITATITNAGEKKPAWVEKRPANPFYYTGIGMALKSNNNYQQIAKENALQDLSSEITINISSEVILEVVEDAEKIVEELKSQIQSKTKTNLEGYELVDSWDGENEYWLYYRLSKDKYADLKKERIKSATELGLNLFSNAKEKTNDPSAALNLYLQSIDAIAEFITEPLQVNYQGSKIYLQNTVFTELQTLLNVINLTPTQSKINAKVGRPIKTAVSIEAKFQNANPINNLPLRFYFSKGGGELIEFVQTNISGIANCTVSKINSNNKIQILNAEIALFQDTNSLITQSFLKNLNIPATKIILEVSSLLFFIEASEIHLGQNLDIKYIEPKIKNTLTDKGFAFSDDIANADIYLQLKATSRKGAEVYNLFSSFADLTLSATNLSTGDEIYKNSLNGIKGIQLDYDKASVEALKNAGNKINELLPDLIAKIQN